MFSGYIVKLINNYDVISLYEVFHVPIGAQNLIDIYEVCPTVKAAIP
jgi:hypothetical protein